MFGIDLFDASLLPAMLVALAASVLSLLRPCVLPIVPPYLAYVGGITMNDIEGDIQSARRKALIPAIFFVMGLSTVFIFGLHFLGIIRIALLDREVRLDAGDKDGSTFGSYVLGLAFALAGPPALAHNWVRSCPSRRKNRVFSEAPCCSPSTLLGLVYRSFWRPRSLTARRG